MRDHLAIQKPLHTTQVTPATVWITALGVDICPGITEKIWSIRQYLAFPWMWEGALITHLLRTFKFKMNIFFSLSQSWACGYEDSIEFRAVCILQLLQDTVEIWNPIWTLISDRDCAGEVKKLGSSGNTNIGNERKYMLWFKPSRCRQTKNRAFLFYLMLIESIALL